MYTAREVTVVLGMSSGRLRSYLRAGLVAPAKGDDEELRFSFQDLVLLRKAEGLVTERIAPRRVQRALRLLRERLPNGVPLSGVQLTAEGSDVVVDDGEKRWHPDSGQVVFDFRRPAARIADAQVASLAQARATAAVSPRSGGAALAPVATPTAYELYERGCSLEEAEPVMAREAYRQALEVDPHYADAHVNLGRLLHEAGEVHAALIHYRAALAVRPADATAAFNVGVALEDLASTGEAIDAYRAAINSQPANADAHYNLARLLEQTGRPEE